MSPTSSTASRVTNGPPDRATEPATAGRPRDRRIDDAVLAATVDLLEEVGYLKLTVAAVAERAGTTKPAIYRRWPTKAQLVHEAVFPLEGRAQAVPPGDDLRSDIASLVSIGVELLSRPAARAALPGLMAETAGDAATQGEVLARFGPGTWGWLTQRIDDAVAAGAVRAGVDSSTVLELIAGSTFVATAVRPPDQLGSEWVDHIVDIIVRGIAP